jgi:dipeptidase E
MRLYISSYRLGNKPEELVKLFKDNKRIAIIPNAVDFREPEEITARIQKDIDDLQTVGMSPDVVDLKEYFGKREELRSTLMKYDGIWVRGGNVFVLRRAFYYSGADQVITDLVKHDQLVYGGYSAGSCLLSPTLRGIELVDDPSVIPAGYEEEIVWDGLSLIPYSIAPHYKSEHPESDEIERCIEYFKSHQMPYKPIKDGEAIVTNGDTELLIH